VKINLPVGRQEVVDLLHLSERPSTTKVEYSFLDSTLWHDKNFAPFWRANVATLKLFGIVRLK
jgi:hypothetical protein